MNIEQKIRNERASFDDVKMPEGSRERFEARLRRDGQRPSEDTRGVSVQKMRFMTWTSLAAAAVAILIMVVGLKNYDTITTHVPQNDATADSKLVEMRQFYDSKVEEAIIDLEDVMENVDDSTKMQINAVIRDLMNMGNVFAEMAPMPEDRQMAIAEQIYDKKLKTIELITKKINK